MTSTNRPRLSCSQGDQLALIISFSKTSYKLKAVSSGDFSEIKQALFKTVILGIKKDGIAPGRLN
jgi:hypothetical protein